MRKLTRLFALMMALTMLLGALPALAEEPANPSGIPYYKVTSDLYDFIDMDGAPIQIEIYSQLANYSGRQTGWGAALMKDLFNVELVIIPDQDGTYQTRTQSGNLGDIVVWGANGEDYKQAIKNGCCWSGTRTTLRRRMRPTSGRTIRMRWRPIVWCPKMITTCTASVWTWRPPVRAISPSCTLGICAGICILSSATRKSRTSTI